MKQKKGYRRLLDAPVMVYHSLFCRILGFEWLGRGWSSATFDKSIPAETPFQHFWECSRCGLNRATFETSKSVQNRFDGYNAKYGDKIIDTNAFSAPKP